jgi:hypothetical protein
VQLPPDAADDFGNRARVTFDGVLYTGSTMPLGDSTFAMGILESIRKQAGVDVGDTVSAELAER